MTRARVAGPRSRLDEVLSLLLDAGVLHVTRSPARASPEPERRAPGPSPENRRARQLQRMLDDAEAALTLLAPGGLASAARATSPPRLDRAAHRARRVLRAAGAIARRIEDLRDERALLLRHREFFEAFATLLGHELAWPDGKAFHVVLRAGAGAALQPLRAQLETAVDSQVELLAKPLPGGETAVLILAPARAAPEIARLLAEARVEELPAPRGIGDENLLRALPAIRARLRALPSAIAELEHERRRLRDDHAAWLQAFRAWLHDRLLLVSAQEQALVGEHLFVVEGWLPTAQLAPLAERVRRALGPDVLVEAAGTAAWSRRDAPVTLSNPPLFRPFEIITRLMPLPRYGSIDPTPFVAVFFPMFFGVMLGDIGYGSALAGLAIVLRLRSKPGTTLRSASAVAGACAAFAIVFGFVFGELFGTLGRAVGLRPLAFDRADAIVPFLVLAVGLGIVHVTLGLVLAVVTAARHGHGRRATGRGAAAIMVGLTTLATLAAIEVLPRALLTPLSAGILAAFVALVAAEGVASVIEMISTFGHVLSYARIMALGTASIMLAVVANEAAGAMGSALVGALFALTFHLVNFAIGLFSPAIHALRLHYVEFFGTFYSPGGAPYRPLAHWTPMEKTA